jgi:Oxidoreductase NAD-binding domain
MEPREILVPAVITNIRTIDPGEIRVVTLTLPDEYEVAGTAYRIEDEMRPGNAFLARPVGARTGRIRRRMYTRSNCSLTSPRVLETIINHTHEEKADTSIWWQTEQIDALVHQAGTIDIRVDFSPDRTHLRVFENTARIEPTNLRLEPDNQWPFMRFAAVALSTGITPFLAYLRYMKARDFGRAYHPSGCYVLLIASVRHPGQLMEHEELLELERRFPNNFKYYPVLTRQWPFDWPYGRGRIIHSDHGLEVSDRESCIDLKPLLRLVPDVHRYDVRMCGNALCRDQLVQGLQQYDLHIASFRSEVW